MDKVRNRNNEIRYGTQGLFLMLGFPSLYNIFMYVTGIEKLANYMMIMHLIKYILFFPVLFYFLFCYRKIGYIVSVSIGFAFILFLAYLNLGMNHANVIPPAVYFFGYTFALLICLDMLKEPDVIIRQFRSIAYIGCLEIVAISLFGNVFHIYPGYTDYMVMGNGGAIYVSALIYWTVRERKTYDILLCILDLICYALFASRGSVLAVLAVFVYFIFFGNVGFSKVKRISIIASIGMLGTIFVLNMHRILIMVSIVAEKYNWSMGKLLQAYLYTGNMFQSKSRLLIWTEIWGFFLERWMVGYGPMSSVKLTGGYSHNIELDILLDFGLIVGGAFIVIIWVTFLKILFYSRYQSYSTLCAIFVMPGFVILHLSGYWYNASYLFVLLFISHLTKRTMRKTNIFE